MESTKVRQPLNHDKSKNTVQTTVQVGHVLLSRLHLMVIWSMLVRWLDVSSSILLHRTLLGQKVLVISLLNSRLCVLPMHLRFLMATQWPLGLISTLGMQSPGIGALNAMEMIYPSFVHVWAELQCCLLMRFGHISMIPSMNLPTPWLSGQQLKKCLLESHGGMSCITSLPMKLMLIGFGFMGRMGAI